MSSVLSSLSLSIFASHHTLWHHIYITAWSEVAQIFRLGEQTSVVVGHRQMNGV